MNKINEIKLSMATLKTNFKKEADYAVTNGKGEDPLYKLSQKSKNVALLEEKARSIQKHVAPIQSLEYDLGLPDNVKDEDLQSVGRTMEKALDQAHAQLRAQSVAEQQEKASHNPQPEEKVAPVNEWNYMENKLNPLIFK